MRPQLISLKLTTADADGVCQAQTLAAAGDLVLNGALYKADTTAHLGTAAAIRITSAGDDTGITFTVYGTDNHGGSVEETVTGASGSYVDTVTTFKTIDRIIASGASAGNVSAGTAEDIDSLTTAAAVSAAGALGKTGNAWRKALMCGTVELVPAQVVYIESDGDESGLTFTVYGRDADGIEISEDITGPNATSASGSELFAEVIGVYSNGAGTGSIVVGTSNDNDYICESQTPSGASYLILNGTGCDLQARHVSIYCSANMSSVTFTVNGLDRRGLEMSEEITGPNATTVKGSKNFSVIHTVRASAAVGTNVTVGSADECESPLIPVDSKSTKVTWQVHRSSDADFDDRVGFSIQDVLSGSPTEYTATLVYPNGWQVQDEAQSTDGAISALRLEVRSFVLGTVTMDVLCPAFR